MYLSICYNNKEDADLVCTYINRVFTMANNYPLSVEANPKSEYKYNRYRIIMDDYCKQYTIDLEKMTTAASDYLAGWKDCKKAK